MRATNGQRQIRIALHVRDLKKRRQFEMGVHWSGRELNFGFYVRVRHTRSGTVPQYFRYDSNDVEHPVWRCGESRATTVWRPKRDRIILTAPHRCLRHYDAHEVVNRWRFEASSSGVVDGERRFDTPRQDITLSRG